MIKLRLADVFVDPYGSHWRAVEWVPWRGRWAMKLRSLRQPVVTRTIAAHTLYHSAWYTKVGQQYRGLRRENHQPV